MLRNSKANRALDVRGLIDVCSLFKGSRFYMRSLTELVTPQYHKDSHVERF